MAWNFCQALGASFHCGAPLGGDPQASNGQPRRRQRRSSAGSPDHPGPSAQGSRLRAAPPASRRRPFPSRRPGQWAKRPRLFRRRQLPSRRVRLRVPGLPLRWAPAAVPSRSVPRGEPACLPRGSAGRVPLLFLLPSSFFPSARGAAGPAAAGRTAGDCRAPRGESAGEVRVPHRALLCVPRWPRRRQATG